MKSSGKIGLKKIDGVQLGVVLLPYVLYFLLTWPLFDWLVDDAGITFAYARSLAGGDGLVSQPGMPPVEGYSNFLWLILMVPFFLLKIFHPYLVPKILSALLVLATFWLVHRLVDRFTGGKRLASLAVLIMLSLNTSFVAWTCSGLENPLYVFLIVVAFFLMIEYYDGAMLKTRLAAVIALAVTGIALTRPDGIVYAGLFPLVVVCEVSGKVLKDYKKAAVNLGVYAVVLLITYGGFILFRLLYFGRLLPNTAYVKGGPRLGNLIPAFTLQEPFLSKFKQLSTSVFGTKLALLLPVIAVVLITLWLLHKNDWRKKATLIFFTFTGYFVYLIMPGDWMGEFRFASPFFVFYYILLAVIITSAVERYLRRPRLKTITALGLTVIFTAIAIKAHQPRLQSFYHRKLVAFDRVARLYPEKFNLYAEKLGVEDGSVLLPDVGATLYYSKLKVYDLVGLCDTTIANSVRKDRKRFYDYIFKEIKPSFIHIHGNWTYLVDFDADVRFRKDYLPVSEYRDKWIENKVNKIMMSGDYVRRDIVEGKEEILENLK